MRVAGRVLRIYYGSLSRPASRFPVEEDQFKEEAGGEAVAVAMNAMGPVRGRNPGRRDRNHIGQTLSRARPTLKSGGDGWESNPPRTPQQRPANGFADRGLAIRRSPSRSAAVRSGILRFQDRPHSPEVVRQLGCHLGCQRPENRGLALAEQVPAAHHNEERRP